MGAIWHVASLTLLGDLQSDQELFDIKVQGHVVPRAGVSVLFLRSMLRQLPRHSWANDSGSTS